MWIASSVEEVEDAVTSWSVSETASFDVKEKLPNNTKELAKDVAAVTVDGGVLLYGVGEDKNGRPTRLVPFDLQGAAERVSNIVRTCIQEVPEIETIPLYKGDNSSEGYLVVVVPRSDRAPHMVIKGNDNRYYGRDADGNRRLSEGEVARLLKGVNGQRRR